MAASHRWTAGTSIAPHRINRYNDNVNDMCRQDVLRLKKSVKPLDIVLAIETTIQADSTTEQSRVAADGSIYQKGDVLYCTYKEAADGGEIRHTIKIASGRVTILRRGAVEMRQQFIPSRKTEGEYKTPYGLFPIAAKTKELQFAWDEKRLRGQLLLAYDLWIKGNYTGFYTVKIVMEGAQS